ncbi:MAG: LysR family transcriptional regulator [Thermoanaerobaculia bacterium]
MAKPSRYALVPRFRVARDAAIALGPGKADLLEAISAAGSLAAAARTLEMSYMRAWKLTQVMNAAFREPLVEMQRGGRRHGSASLTLTGLRVLSLYREIERRALAGATAPWRKLERLLEK